MTVYVHINLFFVCAMHAHDKTSVNNFKIYRNFHRTFTYIESWKILPVMKEKAANIAGEKIYGILTKNYYYYYYYNLQLLQRTLPGMLGKFINNKLFRWHTTTVAGRNDIHAWECALGVDVKGCMRNGSDSLESLLVVYRLVSKTKKIFKKKI